MKAQPEPDPKAKASLGDAPSVEPIFCTHGETLCRVHIWTEAKWDALDPSKRPAAAEHIPGLGWVAPVPDRGPW